MELISMLNEKVIWGVPMLAAMLFTGGYFSLRTGFFQIRRFGHCMKSTLFSSSGRKKEHDGSVSQFQAMCSALAATLGTGNIAGVSAALAVGGAGAVFWMWVSAVFGMMTGYAENVLGIYYRRKEGGTWRGGAMCYIRGGLSEKRFVRRLAAPLASLFAALCMLAAFGMGNMAQMNSAAEALRINFGVPQAVTGAVLAAAAALIIFGGVKRIAAVTEKLVPLMSGFYIIGALYILIANAERIPSVFSAIFEGAFGLGAVGGGIFGAAVKHAVSVGFRRGVFSNEAGLGTSVAAHSASSVREPVVQGMWSIFEVFFDTIVMCSLTAFVLLASPCRAMSAEEALNSVTADTQYFCLSDSGTLITDGKTLPETIKCRTAYGDALTAETGGIFTFSNIMTVRGVTDGGGKITGAVIAPLDGSGLATYAFSQTFGGAAGKLLAVAVVMFAFSTVVGWSWFGSEAAVYLFGARAAAPFKVIFVVFAAIGACADMSLAWGISDALNGLMAVPNLFAVLCLSGKVLEITRNYSERVFRGKKIKPMLSAFEDNSE